MVRDILRIVAVLVAGAVAASTACSESSGFLCSSDDECKDADIQGVCEDLGYCSFPDEVCATGRRFGELAPDGIAGFCVPPPDPTAPRCGDEMVNRTEEQCDGGDLAGQNCALLGFAGGALQCSTECQFDTMFCDLCGNGVVDEDELCDGTEFEGAQTCADVGLGAPDEPLGCTHECTHDFSMCSACGDGTLTPPEECDSDDVGGATCESLGQGVGEVACTGGCTLDTSGCALCNNGVREGPEACDGADLGDATCVGQGLGPGPLGCTDECTLDVSGCSVCGDGQATQGEQCDQLDLGDHPDCASLGFFEGELSCGDDCTYDVSQCEGEGCGDGTKNGTEECDGTDFGGETCVSLGWEEGELVCVNCRRDDANCSTCGDGDVTGDEQCDGDNHRGETCETRGFAGGVLRCNAQCQFNEGLCCNADTCVQTPMMPFP